MDSEDKQNLSIEEFRHIRDFIHDKSGIYFTDNKVYLLRNRLRSRMDELGLTRFNDYFYRLKYDTSRSEFNKLMVLITTNETSFFRNEPQLRSFELEALPLVIKRIEESARKKIIRIWSAGCSTGEEPYTLAMILKERLPKGWYGEIMACDISEQVLSKARRGQYHKNNIKTLQRYYRDKYFTLGDDLYTIKPEIKAMVKFSHVNLSETNKLHLFTGFDFVFCRNVMIYFSDEVKKRIVKAFYQSLNPGGFFYVGHSESLHGISKAFKLMYFKEALVYEKEGALARSERRAGASAVTPSVLATEKVSTNSDDGFSRAMELLRKARGNVEAHRNISQSTMGR
ncbi:MAG: protein-glutamate O-methyltransferase CheR [candidate division Zixibacteria bacterium]|nr:protein-glutamate O-methyltransferase CheR [candidate division Zixibacteria bacterium]